MIEMTTETVLKSLIETMQVSREVHDRRFDQLGQKIEDLAVQVSHLTTSVDQMSRSVTLMAQSVDRISQAVDGHLQVSQQQSLNIAELTKLVASQSNTVNRLIDRVVA
jgi:methyl-accepting chemotaxis protein